MLKEPILIDLTSELVQEYGVSPNIESDSGLTPLELAARTGSIECLQLLLSLGANSSVLANQDLFTEVSMSGSRYSHGQSTTMGNRTLLSIIISIVRILHTDAHRLGDTDTAIKDLLNGRYQTSPHDTDLSGSPLELCLSISNYDSVFALLGLGADPNSYNSMPPLHIAVALREPALVALLLSYGANPNLRANKNDEQDTALHQVDTHSVTAFFDPPRNEIFNYEQFIAEGVTAVDTVNISAVKDRTRACIDVLLFFEQILRHKIVMEILRLSGEYLKGIWRLRSIC